MENTFYPYIEDDNFNDKYYDVNYALQIKENFNNFDPSSYNPKTYNQYNQHSSFNFKQNESFQNKSESEDEDEDEDEDEGKNENYIWGVNSNDNIYRKNGNAKWEKIDGDLKNISASNKDYIWGVNTDDNIYVCKKPCTNGQWKQIDGSLKQVSGGEKELWGINSANNIYKRNIDGSGSWTTMKGVLTNISASGKDYIWGVNDIIQEIKLRIKIVVGTKPNTNFNILGKIKSISLLGDTGLVSPLINVSNIKPIDNDSTLIVDINISKDVKNIGAIQFDIINDPFLITNLDIQIKDAFDNYKNILKSVDKKFISKKENTYSFKTFDLSKEIPRIYRCKTDCNGDWENIKGDMDMVSGGSEDVWGIKKENVYKRTISKKDADWIQVPGSLKWVSASSDNFVWGIDNNDQIFKCKQPCNEGEWNMVPGKLKQVSGGYEPMEIKNNNSSQDLLTQISNQKKAINNQKKLGYNFGTIGGSKIGISGKSEEEEEDEAEDAENKGYLLLARQTINGVFFPKKTLGTTQFNQDKPDELNYMNGKLLTDDFKFNEKYTFKLKWPNSDLKEQIWKQSTNPFISNNVSGYEPIDVPYNINYWGGLRNGVGDAVLSGSMNGDWFYAVGTYKFWSGGIPGPNKPVSSVELYVKKNKYVQPKTDFELGCGADYGKNIPCCDQPGTTVDSKYICSKEKPICKDYIFGSKWGKCVSSNELKLKNGSNINMNMNLEQNNYTLKFFAIGRTLEDGPNKMEIYAGNNAIFNFTPPKDIWKKYEVSFTNNSPNFDLKFMGLIREGDHSSAITGIHLLKNNITVFNNNFSNPQIQFNSYEYITSKNNRVPGWNFNATLINNSTAWGYKIPYPDGNQAVSFQKAGQYIIKNINLNNTDSINKKKDTLNKDMSQYKTLLKNINIPSEKDVSIKTLSKSVDIKKNNLGNFDTNESNIIDFYENFSNSTEVNDLDSLTFEGLREKNTSLIQKYEIQTNQLKEISEKEKLYNKNSKMLQIIQSRNSFKRKIISTLIAAIFLFLIITIATFVYYKRTLK